MGLGNFIKRQAGIGRLPKSQLNENTIIKIFNGGAPFIVSLPIYDTVRVVGGSSISKSMGNGFSQRVYSPGYSRKEQRKITTTVNCTFQQLTIRHAQNNGKHIFINIGKIYSAGLHSDSVSIELDDGRRFVFTMNNDIKNQWKTLGFSPQSALNVFYKMVHGVYLNGLINQQRLKEQKKAERIESIKRIQAEKRIEKRKEKERELAIKKIKRIEKEIQKDRKQTIDEFTPKIKKVKEIYDIEAISQEEFDDIKTDFIEEIKSIPIPPDMNTLPKIKEFKELLDMDALTQQEFDDIKTDFIEEIKSIPIPQDVDPLKKIKECKELLDLGVLTQEEFDELKNIYLKKV